MAPTRSTAPCRACSRSDIGRCLPSRRLPVPRPDAALLRRLHTFALPAGMLLRSGHKVAHPTVGALARPPQHPVRAPERHESRARRGDDAPNRLGIDRSALVRTSAAHYRAPARGHERCTGAASEATTLTVWSDTRGSRAPRPGGAAPPRAPGAHRRAPGTGRSAVVTTRPGQPAARHREGAGARSRVNATSQTSLPCSGSCHRSKSALSPGRWILSRISGVLLATPPLIRGRNADGRGHHRESLRDDEDD